MIYKTSEIPSNTRLRAVVVRIDYFFIPPNGYTIKKTKQASNKKKPVKKYKTGYKLPEK
jgi:hypothetical protein